RACYDVMCLAVLHSARGSGGVLDAAEKGEEPPVVREPRTPAIVALARDRPPLATVRLHQVERAHVLFPQAVCPLDRKDDAPAVGGDLERADDPHAAGVLGDHSEPL